MPAAEADEFAASLGAAGIRLSAVEEALDPLAREAAREDLARPDLDRLREGTTAVEGDLELARAGIGRADAALERHARLGALEADVVRLHAAVLAEAAEDLVRERAGDLAREAESRVAADRADNGIIDDEEFGFKARGFVTAERRYADIGQITEW